jgi:hypothetical protein
VLSYVTTLRPAEDAIVDGLVVVSDGQQVTSGMAARRLRRSDKDLTRIITGLMDALQFLLRSNDVAQHLLRRGQRNGGPCGI